MVVLMTPREAAYLATLSACREEGFASEALDRWAKKDSPSGRDFALAREIAYGSLRMALALDHCAKQLSDKGRLQLKLKERVLLRTALYQWAFMDKVPVYAIADESIRIAKKHCHSRFVSFLNALLRKLGDTSPSLPDDWSIRYSIPQYLLDLIIEEYGRDQAEGIFQAYNQPGVTTARIRGPDFKVIPVKDVEQVAASTEYYIQNITQATLMGELCQQISPPERVLDLCAAPGGKTIAAHDAFPKASLYANDVSEAKLEKVRENLTKYGVEAQLRCGVGEEYPLDQSFPLVIADLPCSNSGVLNKRPEARWRINAESLEQLLVTQKSLLKRASALLKPGGHLFLMTCSILKCENQALVDYAINELDLSPTAYERAILPNLEGWDGGFACLLRKKEGS